MVPLRWIFRSRYAAIAWSAGICLTAVRVAGHHAEPSVDAVNTTDGVAAVAAALNAEEPN